MNTEHIEKIEPPLDAIKSSLHAIIGRTANSVKHNENNQTLHILIEKINELKRGFLGSSKLGLSIVLEQIVGDIDSVFTFLSETNGYTYPDSKDEVGVILQNTHQLKKFLDDLKEITDTDNIKSTPNIEEEKIRTEWVDHYYASKSIEIEKLQRKLTDLTLKAESRIFSYDERIKSVEESYKLSLTKIDNLYNEKKEHIEKKTTRNR